MVGGSTGMGKGAIFLVFFFRGGVVWVAVHCTETVRPEIYFRACQVENPSHCIVRKDTVWTTYTTVSFLNAKTETQSPLKLTVPAQFNSQKREAMMVRGKTTSIWWIFKTFELFVSF